MYIQIIIIFVLLGISMALHAVTISMLLKIRREGTGSMQDRKETRSVSNRGKAQKTPYPNNQDVRIVFCKIVLRRSALNTESGRNAERRDNCLERLNIWL